MVAVGSVGYSGGDWRSGEAETGAVEAWSSRWPAEIGGPERLKSIMADSQPRRSRREKRKGEEKKQRELEGGGRIRFAG